jgi:hypothetical protein
MDRAIFHVAVLDPPSASIFVLRSPWDAMDAMRSDSTGGPYRSSTFLRGVLLPRFNNRKWISIFFAFFLLRSLSFGALQRTLQSVGRTSMATSNGPS